MAILYQRLFVIFSTLLLASASVANSFFAVRADFAAPNFYFFIFMFALTILSRRASVFVLALFLPIIQDVFTQLNALGWGAWPESRPIILDIVSGQMLGWMVFDFLRKKSPVNAKPPQAAGEQSMRKFPFYVINFSILMSVLTGLVIARNLYQSASVFSVRGLLFNFSNHRYLGWFYDYLPIYWWLLLVAGSLLAIRLASIIDERGFVSRLLIRPFLLSCIAMAVFLILQSLFRFGWIPPPRGLSGFLPDLHALASVGLISLVACVYYIPTVERKSKWLGAIGALAGLVIIILSSSKFSMLVASLFVFLFIYKEMRTRLGAWSEFRKNALGLFVAVMVFGGVWVGLGESNQNILKGRVGKIVSDTSWKNFDRTLSGRPEIFAASFRMFKHYPMMGVGPYQFARQSSVKEFSGTPYFHQRKGENAHNYFLQFLVECGLLGLLAVLPLFRGVFTKHPDSEVRLLKWILIAVAAGNVYGHSLLIPSVLISGFVFIGAFAALAGGAKKADLNPVDRYYKFVFAAFIAMGMIEYVNSFGKIPYERGEYCFAESSGRVGEFVVADYSTSFKKTNEVLVVDYNPGHPDVGRRPLDVVFKLSTSQGDLVQSVTDTAEVDRQIKFDLSDIALDSPLKLNIRSSRCYIPLNLGISLDGRRRGIKLKKISQEAI